MEHLHPYEEDVIELSMDPQMAELYAEFEETLKEALCQALAIGDNSFLGGTFMPFCPTLKEYIRVLK